MSYTIAFNDPAVAPGFHAATSLLWKENQGLEAVFDEPEPHYYPAKNPPLTGVFPFALGRFLSMILPQKTRKAQTNARSDIYILHCHITHRFHFVDILEDSSYSSPAIGDFSAPATAYTRLRWNYNARSSWSTDLRNRLQSPRRLALRKRRWKPRITAPESQPAFPQASRSKSCSMVPRSYPGNLEVRRICG